MLSDKITSFFLDFLVWKKQVQLIASNIFISIFNWLDLTLFFGNLKKREGFKYTKYYVTICPIIFYENNIVELSHFIVWCKVEIKL